MQFIKIANENNFDHVVSIQNEYSLLCRFYDTDLAEVSHNENISLLSYSPLAAGYCQASIRMEKYQKNHD